MEAGGQPQASPFTPMGRSSPPLQMNRRLSKPLIQSGYLRGEKILVHLLVCFLDTRSEMLCFQNVQGDSFICPSLCVSFDCSCVRKFSRLNSSAAQWILKKTLGLKVTTVAATKLKTRLQFERSVAICRKRQCDIPEEWIFSNTAVRISNHAVNLLFTGVSVQGSLKVCFGNTSCQQGLEWLFGTT